MFLDSGNSLAISGNAIYLLSNSGMNTMIAGSSGCLTVFVLHFLLTKKISLVMMCNGKLAGLVAGTAYIY